MEYPSKKPTKRYECRNMPRPCPFVSCKYNLVLDNAKFKKEVLSKERLNNLGNALFELDETCVLDVCEQRGVTFNKLGKIFGIGPVSFGKTINRILFKIATSAREK